AQLDRLVHDAAHHGLESGGRDGIDAEAARDEFDAVAVKHGGVARHLARGGRNDQSGTRCVDHSAEIFCALMILPHSADSRTMSAASGPDAMYAGIAP